MADQPPGGRSRLPWLLPVVIVAAAGFVIRLMLGWNEPAVYVTVVNRGPQPLHLVTVEMNDRAHSLGDLAVGQAVRRKAVPLGPTTVAVGYTAPDGRRVRLDVPGGEFKPGDRGEVTVELRDGEVEAARFDVTPGE